MTFIQRHGTALNLNVHLHILALDGVYTFGGERPRLHRVAPPAGEELERLLDTLIARMLVAAPGIDRHPWRSDAGSDITDARVIAAILAHLESRAARAPPPTQH